MMDDTSLIKDIAPDAKNLEGYMYPNTYNLPRDAKPADVIKIMVEQFKKTWRPEWTEQAKAIGRTPQEIVTIEPALVHALPEAGQGRQGDARPAVVGDLARRRHGFLAPLTRRLDPGAVPFQGGHGRELQAPPRLGVAAGVVGGLSNIASL